MAMITHILKHDFILPFHFSNIEQKETGRQFDDVLNEAQEKGYAETPPDLDVDGIDTAHKISLVASVATGCVPSFESVHTEGIRSITGEDVDLANQLGFSIKLLGIVSQTAEGKILQRVHPALIPLTTSLGSTHGVTNGLLTVGDFVGPVFSQGPGAGREATASAAVADLMDLAMDNIVPIFGVPVSHLNQMESAGMEDRVGRYFLRFSSESDRMSAVRILDLANVLVEAHAESGDQRCVVTYSAEESVVMPLIQEMKKTGVIESMLRVEGPW